MGVLQATKNFSIKDGDKDPFEFLASLASISTNYDTKTIKEIEAFIKATFPRGGNPPLATTILQFGVLFARTLIKNFGATWDTENDSDYLDDINLIIDLGKGSSLKIRPFMRVSKFFDDPEDSMLAMYYMIDFNANNDIHSEEYKERFADEDGWISINTPDGLMKFRGIEPTPEQLKDLKKTIK